MRYAAAFCRQRSNDGVRIRCFAFSRNLSLRSALLMMRYHSDANPRIDVSPFQGSFFTCSQPGAYSRGLEFGHFASRRDEVKIARHFSAGIMHQVKDESRRDD
jgi:hypothetical protein